MDERYILSTLKVSTLKVVDVGGRKIKEQTQPADETLYLIRT